MKSTIGTILFSAILLIMTGCSSVETNVEMKQLPNAELGDEYIDKLTKIMGELIEEVGIESVSDNQEEETPLISYDVIDDELSNPILEVEDKKWEQDQQDIEKHTQLWQLFANIVPSKERNMVTGFYVFTDGAGNTLGAVEPRYENPEEWLLSLDIAEMDNTKELIGTIIHEFGHLLFLNQAQVPYSEDLEDEQELETLKTNCVHYFTSYGCSAPKSYINQFYQRYWLGIIEEWESLDVQTNEEDLDHFFTNHENEFLTDYAATDPSEDIAETWTYFILSYQPEVETMADEKISFFYEFPELVELRATLLSNLYKVISTENSFKN
ncbi:hypothetical protein [Chengkuizengella sediminis]|uniref:hypothetical protein n=1 Tax=Chengkuizengella sediminis TaxID=1885917 RepID=UPI0013898F20|nr:hypothetical protein [Chengkuizengella sediminis]NDI35863.1 hypothetical protein [Chengkuizengella sediminis]